MHYVKSKQNSLLALAVFSALSLTSSVYAADYVMPDMTISGVREGLLTEVDSTSVVKPLGVVADQEQSAGLLGAKDALDTPFTSMTTTRQSLDYFGTPAKGPTDMLSLNPSVRDSSSSLYNDISIRGFKINGHGMYLNGIPGMLDQQHAADVYIDKATVISGPNIGIVGTPNRESAAGTVEFTSKRAQVKPNTDITLAYLGGSSMKEVVDIGRRFHNNRYGIRIMADNIHGNTAIKGENIKGHDFFVNVDQKTANSKTNLLVGYNYINQHASPYTFGFDNSLTALPSAPDANRTYKTSYSYNQFDNWIVTLNHEQKLNNHMTAFFNGGYHREDWFGYIDGSPKIINANGDYTIKMTNYPLGITSKYSGVGIKGKFKTGSLKHDYVVNVDRHWYEGFGGNVPTWGNNGSIIATGNIFTHALDGSQYYLHNRVEGGSPWSSTQIVNGWHVSDTVSTKNDKWQLLVGLHGHKTTISKKDGSKNSYNGINPTYAIIYKVNPNISVYASHSESFMSGQTVGSAYANRGEVLDPNKTKQNELGVKVKNGKLLHTLSLFEIKQANYNVDSNNYYRRYGEQKDRGVEYTVAGSVSPKLDIIGGFTYLDAKQALNGKQVNGTAKWSSTMALVYKPNTKLSIIGRAQYMGKATIINEKFNVPSHITFDLGANYDTKISGTPVTFNAMLHNVFGKNYWLPMASSNNLLLGQPRTFVMSATMHL